MPRALVRALALLALGAGACSSSDYSSSTPGRPRDGTAGAAATGAGAGGAGGASGAGASGAGGAGASGAGAGGASAGGAGAGGGPPEVTECQDHPWDCPAGTTCWPATADGAKFDCRQSEPVATGSCCQNLIGFATCGDGDLCYGTSATPSACRRLCKLGDTSHPCPASTTCVARALVPGGATFAICEPAPPATCAP